MHHATARACPVCSRSLTVLEISPYSWGGPHPSNICAAPHHWEEGCHPGTPHIYIPHPSGLPLPPLQALQGWTMPNCPLQTSLPLSVSFPLSRVPLFPFPNSPSVLWVPDSYMPNVDKSPSLGETEDNVYPSFWMPKSNAGRIPQKFTLEN